MAKSWKEALLASGLPLENDVQEFFRGKGCITSFEYSYLRPDELNIERQFSYDINAAYVRENHFITIMTECKYRHPGTKWIFLPESYGQLSPNCFMHAIDHFVGLSFPFVSIFPRKLAPACSKGVELAGDNRNHKSITQALLQVAYAMAPKIADAIEYQVGRYLVDDHIFYHVPMIVTTSELFRIKAGVSIKEIREANLLDEVASGQDILVFNYKPGIELKKYNWNIFNDLRERVGEDKLRKKMQTFTNSMDHLFSVLSEYFAPRAFVIISVAKGWEAFDKLFRYIDELLNPSEALLREIREEEAEIDRQLKEMGIMPKVKRRKRRFSRKKPRNNSQ